MGFTGRCAITVLALVTLPILLSSCQPIVVDSAHKTSSRNLAGAQEDALDALINGASGEVAINRRLNTNVPNFVRIVGVGDLLPEFASDAPVDKMTAFFEQYGVVLGIQDADAELEMVDQRIDNVGVHTLTYRQVYEDVQVFGGELKARLDNDNQLKSVSGTFVLAKNPVNPTPSIRSDVATVIAVEAVRRQLAENSQLRELSGPAINLYVYQEGLLEGIPGAAHLVYEVEVVDTERTVREFLYVDAHSGEIVDQITGILEIRRRIYNRRFLPAFLFWQDGSALPVGNPDVANLIAATGQIYSLFASVSGGQFVSWDGKDGFMDVVHDSRLFNCAADPNAQWNGAFTAFCPNLTSDDVVAHEWTHAYSESTHDLQYAFQPGALNESFSDIFGETVDRLNHAGSDSPDTPRTTGSCSIFGEGTPSLDDSYRWLIGEDGSAVGGALRDMWNPVCYGDPAKVTDPEYHCGVLDPRRFDHGGVHTNSGVPNHAYALLVDGGTFNGVTVQGIGLSKAAHIYWRAMGIQTETTDFPAHAEALLAACNELAESGVALPDPDVESGTVMSPSVVVTQADCTQVGNAVNAVELRSAPTQCPLILATKSPPLCAAGERAQSLFATDWEAGQGSWTTGARNVADPATFGTPSWQAVSQLPEGVAGMAMLASNVAGVCGSDNGTGVVFLESPAIIIPQGADQPRMAFTHWIATEYGYDGGNVKVSVNGGDWLALSATAFLYNGYNQTLFPSRGPDLSRLSSNPLAGEDAYTGASLQGSGGNWGQTQIDLSGVAGPGDTVRIRFELGQDQCEGVLGWFVDDVNVYSCSTGQLASTCGNAVLEIGETCDDHNDQGSDGCSSQCQEETGWECTMPRLPSTGSNVVQDGSFRAGPNGDIWQLTPGVIGNPICSVATCGGPEPSNGQFHLWFGGVRTHDVVRVQQLITIPPSAATLSFDLWVNACDSPDDHLFVRLDNQIVFTTDPCTTSSGYESRRVDVRQFADGEAHTLQFESEVFARNHNVSNFFVDNVILSDNQPTLGSPSICTAE